MYPVLHDFTNLSSWVANASNTVAVPTRSDGSTARQGDLLVACVAYGASVSQAATTYDGWTVLGRQQYGTYAGLMAFQREVGPGVVPSSYTFDHSMAYGSMVSLSLVSAHRRPNPVGDVETLTNAAAAASQFVPQLDPDHPNNLFLLYLFAGQGALTTTSTFGTATGGWTERYDSNAGTVSSIRWMTAMDYKYYEPDTADSATNSASTSQAHQGDASIALQVAPAPLAPTNLTATLIGV